VEDNRLFFECIECGVEYTIQTDMDIDPEFCPFCGEPVDILEWKDDENAESES
jgi:rRNA maturation endonuclease Nob1